MDMDLLLTSDICRCLPEKETSKTIILRSPIGVPFFGYCDCFQGLRVVLFSPHLIFGGSTDRVVIFSPGVVGRIIIN